MEQYFEKNLNTPEILPTIKKAKKWKMAVLVWIAIYPTITVLFTLFGDFFAEISPFPLRTFVITVTVVPLMVFLIMPGLQQILSNWINK